MEMTFRDEVNEYMDARLRELPAGTHESSFKLGFIEAIGYMVNQQKRARREREER